MGPPDTAILPDMATGGSTGSDDATATTTTTNTASAAAAARSENAMTPTDQVECLGDALAGVSLGQTSPSFGVAAVSSASFALASSSSPVSQPPQPPQRNGSTDAWGDYTTAASESSVVATNSGGINNHLSSSHNESSLHFFLSQDPSRTLGDDVFKLSHPNLPSLSQHEEQQQQGLTSGDAAPAFRLNSHSLAPGGPSKTNAYGSSQSSGGGGGANGGVNGSGSSGGGGEIRNEIRRGRTESPSSAATGTTSSSRSASPYTNGSDVGPTGSRTIQAYQPYDPAQNTSSSDDRSTYSLTHSHPSNQNINASNVDPRTPYGKQQGNNTGGSSSLSSTNKLSGSPYVFDRNAASSGVGGAMQQMHTNVQQQQQQPGQVLYMAVPSPDGRGQVLQPVQMVQLPGKQMAYVVPGGAGGLAAAAPQSAPPPSVVASSVVDNSQSMMVLPPLPSQSHAPPPDPYAMGGLGRVNNSSSNNGGAGVYSSNFDMDRIYMNDLGLPRDDYGRGVGGGGLGVGAAIAQQFQADPAVASLYASPQRPPLDALLGQVRRLSRDQVGCRLVQQALDEEGQMAATLILQEGLPFWGEAMVDPFGNYLFQKILEKVTPDERVMLVKSVSTRLVNASLNLHGTRSVQKVVELCALDEQNGVACKNEEEETAADILTKSLAPAAARLCIDSHGNHVIQRIILKLGSRHSEFVFDAVATSVGDVARHRHGCCVIQRCLDSPPSEARAHLVRRIVEKALELMQDAYGNYVVQYVLDVCSDDDVHAVCEAVVGRVSLLAIQKFSSNVMEKCLERCTERVKEMYMSELSDQERIRELMMDPFGNYVVQRALSVATHAQAIRLVEAMRPHLLATQTGGPSGHRNGGVRNTAGGRRIIAKICRRFPNFTLSAVGSQDELYSRNPNNQEELYSRNKGNHRYHAPVLAYAPVGAPTHAQQHYLGESSYMQGQLPIQQPQTQQPQSYYNLGGAPMGAPTYYDHFGTGGHGGFHGL